MFRTYQTTITRRRLKSGEFLPEKITTLKEEPLDDAAFLHYYDPAIEVLNRMYKEDIVS